MTPSGFTLVLALLVPFAQAQLQRVEMAAIAHTKAAVVRLAGESADIALDPRIILEDGRLSSPRSDAANKEFARAAGLRIAKKEAVWAGQASTRRAWIAVGEPRIRGDTAEISVSAEYDPIKPDVSHHGRPRPKFSEGLLLHRTNDGWKLIGVQWALVQ